MRTSISTLRCFLGVIAVAVLGLAVYSNTFHNSFHFDDFPSIVNNVAIRNIHDWKSIWSFWPTRFVAYFSFALNHHVNGFDILGYHVVSVLIHVAVALVVGWLAVLTTRSPRIAFFTSLIFLVHPLQTQPINYIFQRSVLLAAFFYIGSLALYVKAHCTREERPRPTRWIFYYIGSLASAILAIFSKETAITLPLMIGFYHYCFLKGEKSFPWKMVLPFFIIILLLPLTWLSVHGENLWGFKKAVEGYAGGVTVGQYFLTQIKVMVTYIRLLVVPVHQSVEYSYPLAKTLFEPPVMLSLLFLLAVLWTAAKNFNKYRLMSFGVFWFFITLLPESTIWPNNDVIFEHRLYLPLMGFSLFLASVPYYLFKEKTGTLALRLLLACVALYSVLAYQRNKVWENEFTLWDDAVHKFPHSQRAHLNRGAAYHVRGDLDHALEDYNMVIGLGPVTAITLSNRGAIFYRKGEMDLALANFKLAIEINSGYAGTYVNRGLLYRSQGKLDLALADFDKALAIMPNDPVAYGNRAEVYAAIMKTSPEHR